MDFSNIPFPERLPQFWVINLSGRTGTFPTGSTSKDEAAGTTLRREANLRHPTADNSVIYKKVLGQVEAANFFRFDPKRRPLLGLSVKRNIHTDTRNITLVRNRLTVPFTARGRRVKVAGENKQRQILQLTMPHSPDLLQFHPTTSASHDQLNDKYPFEELSQESSRKIDFE